MKETYLGPSLRRRSGMRSRNFRENGAGNRMDRKTSEMASAIEVTQP